MPIPSHLNHSRAPNTKPEPSDPLASQQRTPEHSDPLASSQRIPDPTHPRPLLFLTSSRFPTNTLVPDPMPFDLHSFASKSIPDVSSVSRLRSGEARSRTFLAQCVLACPFSLSIYLYLLLCLITRYPSFVSSVSSSVPCLHPPSFSSIFILTSVDPTLVILYISYDPFPIVQINPILTTPALV